MLKGSPGIHCDQDAEILPLRELRKQQREGRNAVRSLFDDLDVTSEAELDSRLAEINHRMAHESNTVAEEKKMIALMKKLEVCMGFGVGCWQVSEGQAGVSA